MIDNLFWLRFASACLTWLVICPLTNVNKIIWQVRVAKQMRGAPEWRWMAQYIGFGALVDGALYASLGLIAPFWASAVGAAIGLSLTLILTYDRWLPFSSFRIRVQTGTLDEAMERASAVLQGEKTRNVRISARTYTKTQTKTSVQEVA